MRTSRGPLAALAAVLLSLIVALALAAGSAARDAVPRQERPTLPQLASSQPAPPALATSPTATQRSFVSGLGDDANPCTRTQPCRNFTKAISETLPNGEVIVLDSAGYGPFSVGKSIAIIAPPGVYAGISVFSGDGITVNAPGDTVVLKGLTVNGLGGTFGVRLVDADKLYLQQVTLKRFAPCCRAGLFVDTAGSPRIFVQDTLAHDNGVGLHQNTGTSRMTVVDSRLEGNDLGLVVFSGAKATLRETLIAGNTVEGVQAFNPGTEVALEHATVAENGTGILSLSAAIVRLSETMVTRNSTGLSVGGGQIVSWGNNRVAGNGTDGAPTSTIPQL